LFDSWAGALSPADFRTYALPAIHRIFAGLADLPVPKIYYPGVSSGELLPVLRELAVDVVGLDWRVSLAEGRRRTDNRFAVQGNLDPYVLTAPIDFICEKAKAVMDEGMESPGFIFNLGHGLFPEADLGKLRDLTAYVHEYSRSRLS
jgi:uroporphyrinogen decarboxylase